MTLTSYPGITSPSISATGSYVFPGYAFLVWVLINGTGSVTGVSIPGITGITFSQAGVVTGGTFRLEAWKSTVVAAQQVNTAGISATVTTTGTITSICNTVQIYANVSSFRAATNSSTGTTTAWTFTDQATTVQNQGLAVGLAENINTGGFPGATTVTPAPLYAGNNIVTVHDAGSTMTLATLYGDTKGTGVIPSITGTLAGAPTRWLTLAVAVNGVAITMDDTQPCYMIGETGILLNNPDGSGPPIYDVDKVTGLESMTITSSSQPFDGADGSYVQAKYLTGDTIIIDGRLVTNPPVAQSIIDNMRTCAKPTPKVNGIPFFWKHYGISPRRLQVKPLGFNMDVDRSRTLGNIPFQYQVQATDARAYSPLVSGSQNTPSSGTTYTATIVVGGNTDTFPCLYFNNWGTPRDPGGTNVGWYFSNVTWDQAYPAASGTVASVAVASTGLPTGAFKLDLANLSLTRVFDGADYSSFLLFRRWFGLVGNMINYVTLQRPTGSTVTNEGFSWVYGDAWV